MPEVLSPGRFVGRYEEHYALTRGGTHYVRTQPYIFVGVTVDENGDAITAGQLHVVKLSGVITGRAEYESDNGRRLAYVIEKIDPDVPFR